MFNVGKILKKNISIIIPAAIAVLALLLLVPSFLIRGKIMTRLEEIAGMERNVDSSLRNAVSSKQPEIAEKYQDEHQADANKIDELAKQKSQRELLSYKIFPEPNETSIQIYNEFKKTYKTACLKLVKDLKALDAPTDSEIRRLAGSINMSEVTAAGSDSRKATGDQKIVELICKGRSEEIPVYANPWVFSGYAFWDNWEYRGTVSAVRDCWYCQLACWIHQDVVDTINSINAGSASVAKSSVKRLFGVGFSGGDGKNNGLEMPVYVTEKTGGLCQPWTGRKCNDKIDVVHFSLAVIVNADDVLKFMTELCSEKQHEFSGYKGELPVQTYKHNQITILQSSIEPVDRTSTEHVRYYYGPKAVVYLSLVCEYVFDRQGYDIIKPQSVQSDISGASDEGDGGSRSGGPGGPGGGFGPGGGRF